ncbi:MAG: MarC family protein [Nitrospirae bacterium]|nr:MAG: MarC family protein [Nitrospirota bacterium]
MIFRDLAATFIPIFVAIDIFALLPIFMSCTSNLSREDTERVVRQSVFTGFFVSIAFVLLGERIFSVIGISISDFKIAGGSLLFIIALIEILRGEPREAASWTRETVGVVPIGVPMIVGPALLTTLLILTDQYGILLTILSLLLNLGLLWVLFMNAHRVVNLIGRKGIIALSKIIAILLAAIGVMMIRIGLFDMLK